MKSPHLIKIAGFFVAVIYARGYERLVNKEKNLVLNS